MVFNVFENIKITAVASAVSTKFTSIDEYKKTSGDAEIEKFKKMTGIHGRYDVKENQTSADLCFAAAREIKKRDKFNESEIGILIYITQTPDYRTPSTAYALHKRLNLSKDCMCFDVNLGCSGFVYGATLIASLLTTSCANKGLLLIGDTNAKERTKGEKANQTNTALLFGDAGAAILFEKTENSFIHSVLRSDGTGFRALARPYGAWKHPVGPDRVPSDDIAVFNFTISEVPELLRAFLDYEGKAIEQFDALVLHQANLYIIKQIAKKVKMPMEKVPVSLDKYANTSGASIPITLADAYGECDEHKELNLLMSGFGIGLSWGVLSCMVNIADIYPVIYTDESFDDGYSDKL